MIDRRSAKLLRSMVLAPRVTKDNKDIKILLLLIIKQGQKQRVCYSVKRI